MNSKSAQTPLVSIIVPTFNSEKFLEKTLLSLFSQTYPYIEIIVIDGGSSDSTIDLIKKHSGKITRWISEEDSGQSNAINKGFIIANGEIATWLGSDDIMYRDSVERIVEIFNKDNSIGIVYGDIDKIDENDFIFKKKKYLFLTYDYLLNKNQAVPQPGSFYRMKYLRQVNYLNETLDQTMDYDLFLKLLKISKGFYTGYPLAQFRMHSRNKSTVQGNWKSPIEGYKVSKKYGARTFTSLNFFRLKRLLRFGIEKLIKK